MASTEIKSFSQTRAINITGYWSEGAHFFNSIEVWGSWVHAPGQVMEKLASDTLVRLGWVRVGISRGF